MEKKRKPQPCKTCRQYERDNEYVAEYLKIIMRNVNCCLRRLTSEKYIKQKVDDNS